VSNLKTEEFVPKAKKEPRRLERHLDWSLRETKFLERLENQEIRESIKKRILEYIANEGFSKIMEIGFGRGYEYERLRTDLKRYNVEYIGVDYTLKFVKEARKEYPDAKWFWGDIRKLNFGNNAVDLIFVYHVLEHQNGLKDVRKAIKEMCRVAKEKVIIIWFKSPSIVSKTRHWRAGNFLVYKYSAADIWRIVLETDFIVKEIQWENPWGHGVWILEKKRKKKPIPKKGPVEQLRDSLKKFLRNTIGYSLEKKKEKKPIPKKGSIAQLKKTLKNSIAYAFGILEKITGERKPKQ
jgi:ubiquinone/menaquinone biosynthesis C-methylase UbiE